MITVKLDGFTLTVQGHALFAAPGQDIVCSAASILSATLDETLNHMSDRNMLKRKSWHYDGATLTIKAEPEEGEGTILLRAVYDTICTGYRLLANEYPAYLTYRTT